MNEETINELLLMNQQLLDAIAAADWETYTALCDPMLSAFEPESQGHLIEGMDFHKYYFDLGAGKSPKNTTMCAPHIRFVGETGVILSYVRLVQFIDSDGSPQTSQCQETRVWEKTDDGWKHVHFHRS